MTKKKKKRGFKFRNIIIILLILFFCCLGGYYILNLPIKNIYISGNNVISDNEIISLSGLDDYPSFVLTFGSKIKKNILKHKYIEDVIIRKKIGNIVEIEVVEYRIIALDNYGNVILSSGDVLENNYGVFDVPRLVSYLDDEGLMNFSSKFTYVNNDILREISEIEYSPTMVDNDRFLLYMNDGNLVHITLTKVDKLNKFNDIKDELMGKKGVIYLDSGNYVVVKN